MPPSLEPDYQEEQLDELSDLQMASHLYGITKAKHEEQVEEQLENVYEKVQEYRKAKMPGTRESKMEKGTEIWAEAAKYWDMTDKYDSEALAAATPIFVVHSEGIGVGMQESDDLEDLRERLDGGIEGF